MLEVRTGSVGMEGGEVKLCMTVEVDDSGDGMSVVIGMSRICDDTDVSTGVLEDEVLLGGKEGRGLREKRSAAEIREKEYEIIHECGGVTSAASCG